MSFFYRLFQTVCGKGSSFINIFNLFYNSMKIKRFIIQLRENLLSRTIDSVRVYIYYKHFVKLLICFLLFFSIASVHAQVAIMYSQYMNNMLNINPAYTGSRAGDNITSLYRKQWVNVDGAPTSFSLSWDKGTEDVGDGLHQRSKPVSYGIQLYSDRVGVEISQGIQTFYSYRIKLPRSYIAFGVSAGVMNYQGLFSRVGTAQDGDPRFETDVKGFFPTAGLGFLYANMNWYVGLSAPALLKTKIENDVNKITMADGRYFLTAGYIFTASDYLKIKPSILLNQIQGESFNYNLNLNAWFLNTVGFGVSYRPKDAIVGMFQVQVGPQISLGYAYDYLISSVKMVSAGSHELMIRYEFNRPRNQYVVSPRYY